MKGKTPAILAIVLAGVLWGTSPLFADFLSDAGFSAIQMTATRSGVTALSLGLVLLFLDRGAFRMRPRLILLALFAGVGYFLTATFYYIAIGKIGAATAAVLLYTSPIYVLCVSLTFLGEKLTRAKLLATALMLLGCIFVSGVIGGFSGGILGVAFGLLSGAFYGLYNLMTKIAVQGGARPISLTFYTFLFAALFAITFADPIGYVRVLLSAIRFRLCRSSFCLGSSPACFLISYTPFRSSVLTRVSPRPSRSSSRWRRPSLAFSFSQSVRACRR